MLIFNEQKANEDAKYAGYVGSTYDRDLPRVASSKRENYARYLGKIQSPQTH